MKEDNREQLRLELLYAFNRQNMVLYIGQGATDEELSDHICRLNWSCILTSRCDDGFVTPFASASCQPRIYASSGELPANLFNHREMPVIHLYGDVNDLDCPETMKKKIMDKEAEKKMEVAMLAMKERPAQLIIIGYNPLVDGEFPSDSFQMLCYKKPYLNIDFYNTLTVEDPSIDSLKQMVAEYGFAWHDCSLASLLAEDASDLPLYGLDEGNVTFFKGRLPVTIDKAILDRSDYFAQLLTEQSVRSRIPYGRELQKLWFFNFLQNSSHEPQWYGYSSKTEFYLKRSFEESFLALVKTLLSGKSLDKSRYNTPIILQGSPGSSKSIELGAIAYRIYDMSINPVIFMKNEGLSFSSTSDELMLLDELMLEIERHGEKDTRILLIWDSASYRNVTKEADNLIQLLSNTGRRFVLICTAYAKKEQPSDGSRFYRYNKDGNFQRLMGADQIRDSDIRFDGRHYFISATRILTDNEKIKLKQKAKSFGITDTADWQKKWKKLEEDSENDIFYYFFMLVRTLQMQLSERLEFEQEVVNRYVQQQLAIIAGETVLDKPEEPAMLVALREAGMDLSFTSEDMEILRDAEPRYDLDRFCTCVAMFSQFKLDTPAHLAAYIFCPNDGVLRQKIYSLVDDIPYILYSNNEMDFVFRFRHSLEAELFISRRHISAEKQVELVVDMLDYYARSYRELRVPDDDMATILQTLLRMIGPNTEYEEFGENGTRYEEHLDILRQLTRIIEKLRELRIVQCIPDDAARFALLEVTFSRELYGKFWAQLRCPRNVSISREESDMWDIAPEAFSAETYEKRAIMLQEVIILAKRSQDKLMERLNVEPLSSNARKFINDQFNSFAVERALCNAQLDKVKSNYSKYCTDSGIVVNEEVVSLKTEPYLSLYQMLCRAIMSEPSNGYLYNALFQLFERRYEELQRAGDEEAMLRTLSDVRLIADDVSLLDIPNRGPGDELSRHLSKIAEYASEQDVTIDGVLANYKDDPFTKFFADLLARNSATGICFVSQQELASVGLDGYSLSRLGKSSNETEYVLNDAQLAICRKIKDFINRPDYLECVSRDPLALYLLLRVTWMCYNKRLLNDSREAKLTWLDENAWREIEDICAKYINSAADNGRPIVYLLQALATLHLTLDYAKAVNLIERIDRNQSSFVFTPRMRVPYLFCPTPGIPKTYNGKVISLDSNNRFGGFLQLDGMPSQLGNKRGVRFSIKNIGRRQRPKEHDFVKDIEIGLGYMGFSAYTAKGREGDEAK